MDAGGTEFIGSQDEIRAARTFERIARVRAMYEEVLQLTRRLGVLEDAGVHPDSSICINVVLVFINMLFRDGLSAGTVDLYVYDCFRIFKTDSGTEVPQRWKDLAKTEKEAAIERRRLARAREAQEEQREGGEGGTEIQRTTDKDVLVREDLMNMLAGGNAGRREGRGGGRGRRRAEKVRCIADFLKHFRSSLIAHRSLQDHKVLWKISPS